jgi:hypothetical protein
MDIRDNPLKSELPYEPFQAKSKEAEAVSDEVSATFKAAISQSIPTFSPPKEPISGKILDEEVQLLENQQKNLLNLIEEAEALDSTQLNVGPEVIDKIAQEQIKKILDKNLQNNQGMIQSEHRSQNSTENITPIGAGLELSPNAGLEVHFENSQLLDSSAKNPLQPLIIEEAFAKGLPGLEIGVVGANILSRGCVTLASGMVLNKIEEVIKAKEKALEHVEGEEKVILQNEVTVLKQWLAVQMDLFNELLLDSTIMSATSLPKAAAAIVTIMDSNTQVVTGLEAVGTVAESGLSTAAGVIDSMGMGATLIRAALALKEAQDDKIQHDIWTKDLVNKGNLSDVQKILNTQERIYHERLELNKPLLHDLLKNTNAILEAAKLLSSENQTKVMANIEKQLQNEGIEIPFDTPSIIQLQAYLMDQKNYDTFNDMMVKKKEMLSVSIRNALRAFSFKKDEIDKGFLSLALTKARAIFTTAVVVATAIIVLKVLLLVGIIASSAALSATGFGVLAVVALFIIIGAAYLYWKKPNIFMTYVKGVQSKLFFWSLPLAIQKYRLHYSVLETKKQSENINVIALRVLEIEKLLQHGTDSEIEEFSQEYFWSLSRIIPGYKDSKTVEEHKEILRKYQSDLQTLKDSKEKEIKKLNEQVAHLSGSVEYFNEKVQKLQDRVDVAGWKDFQRSLKKKEAKAEAAATAKITPEEDYEILADFLLNDASLLDDSETKRLLLHMGIDLEQLNSIDQKELKKEIGHLIRGFFAMETEDTVSLLNKQTLLKKHGVMEKVEHPMSSEAQRKFEEQRKLPKGKNGIRENTALA